MPSGEVAKLKICLVGDEGVGKTSLIRRYIQSDFDERYLRTIGTVVSKRIVYLAVDGEMYGAALTVWDIVGNRKFAGQFARAYLENAGGVLAVCDLTRPETLEGLGDWMDRIRSIVGEVPIVMLANKRDLEAHVRIEEDDILTLCELYRTPWLETSAKTGENVELAFAKLAEMALRAALARRPADAAPARLDAPARQTPPSTPSG